MSYYNPIHPPIGSGCASNYNALAPAAAGSSANPFKRLPQAVYAPSSKWHNTTGRSNNIHAPIFFSRRGTRGQPVSIPELSGRSLQELSSILEGGEDRVLADTGRQRISFRIMWPGYSQIEWVRSMDIATGGPITRAKLAQLVAQNFSRFIETHARTPCSIPEFQVGPSGIRADHLYLASLNNTFDDSWQADIVLTVR